MQAIADGAVVALSAEARGRVETARRFVEEIVARGDVVYGITRDSAPWRTCGSPRKSCVSCSSTCLRSMPAALANRCRNRSCRAIMALRANVLAKGYSGLPADCHRDPDRPAPCRHPSGHPFPRARSALGRSGPAGAPGAGHHREGQANYQGRSFRAGRRSAAPTSPH